MRVLICDDNKELRIILAVILEKSDANTIVETAATGEDCLDKVRDFLPDILLLDLILPGIDGYKVCETIKNDPILDRTGIIMITGLGDSENAKEKAITSGADSFLTKPIDKPTLMSQIKLVNKAKLNTIIKDHGLSRLDAMTNELFNNAAEG